MGRTAGRIRNAVSGVLVALAVLLAAALGGARLAGFRFFTVLSGSMEPAYPVGSLICVKRTDCARLRPGDVITFLLDRETVVTHRIVEVVPDENRPELPCFRTKGDANGAEDGGTVRCADIIGRPVLAVPKLGYAVDRIRRPPGAYAAVSAGALLLLAVLLSGRPPAGGGKYARRKHPARRSRPS